MWVEIIKRELKKLVEYHDKNLDSDCNIVVRILDNSETINELAKKKLLKIIEFNVNEACSEGEDS